MRAAPLRMALSVAATRASREGLSTPGICETSTTSNPLALSAATKRASCVGTALLQDFKKRVREVRALALAALHGQVERRLAAA